MEKSLVEYPKMISWSLEEMKIYLEGYEHWDIQVDYSLLFIKSEESLSF